MIVEGASSRNLTLGVDYENGSSEVYKMANKSYDKWVEVSLQTDSTHIVDRIFAIADFDTPTNRILIDSIQLFHTPLNHEEYRKGGYQRSIRPAGRKIVLPPDTSTNSSLVPDPITPKPSSSTEKSLGVSTRR